MPSHSILFLGDSNRPEFRAARRGLERFGAVADFPNADAAEAALIDNRIMPDVIVAAQAFPGEFSHTAIDRLRRRAPLARVLGLMGSWCEGEMRTGSPWSAVVRTYWHQWSPRSARNLARLAAGKPTSWALPATAVEEERVLADAAERGSPARGLVVIRSPSLEMAEWLSAACRGTDAKSQLSSTIWQRDPSSVVRVEGAAAAIFDGTDLGDAECDELRRFVAAVHPAPTIVLLSFPRMEDRDRALSLGAAAVLSKPTAVNDLLWELEAGDLVPLPSAPGRQSPGIA